MAATYNVGMHSHDFVYILPWIRDGKNDALPWLGAAGEIMQKDNIYSYLHIYDALILYAYAIRALFNETHDPSSLSDGKLIWNKMRRLQFEGGTTGSVMMDDLADRVPNLAAFMCHQMGKKSQKSAGLQHMLVTDMITGFWPSHDGLLPADEPACGFRNENESRSLRKMPWRIYKDDVKILDEEQLKSMYCAKKHAIVGVNTHVTYHLYPQRRPIKFGREDLKLLTQMKAAVHDNLNIFIGMVFNQGENMLLIWKFCSRGTIQDIIYNQNLTLDEKFHAAFVRDITQGLEYLHASPIGYHGSLSPWACLIDRNWMVKLTDFGIANPIERWEKQGLISVNAVTSDDDRSGPTQRTSVLYCAPEMLKNRELNRRSVKDQEWKKQSKVLRQAGDIYSFGMVMYEILFRSLPFPENTDINELVDIISDGNRTFPPRIIHSRNVHPDLCALLEDCWSENLEVRPTIRRVQLNTKMVLKVKGSLVDQMMSVMEQYATNLEKLVADRTAMLEEANTRADKLLSQLLPPYVANELKLGHSVPPKLFEMATVLFSDIVGFTNICSSSTPLEVVTMLNGLYSGFDECINRNGAYKVETIGDAYMVVSGIPEENGAKHIQCIADVALDMRKCRGSLFVLEELEDWDTDFYLDSYKVPHRSDKLQCRWGFHTGPAAAGVVGLTSPRYCLFGDTGKGILVTYWLEKKMDDQLSTIDVPCEAV
ncbi:Guanylate cyclase [Dirofilaria immitis]|nr:Guanylate cyclase [Dirofilaria immitis]